MVAVLGLCAGKLGRHDLDGLLVASAPRELHDALGEGEQRVVLAHADICAGEVLGAPLAQDDVAGDDALAAKLLHTQALALGVAAVA